MSTIARRLAEAALAIDTVPEQVLAAARLHLLDALGVGLAARAEGPLGTLPTVVRTAGPSTVLGSADPASPATAALVNGGLIHSLEYDDTHVSSVMHGSSVLAPAALAAAEAAGADGRDLLRAFAVGWEVLIRIGLASPGGLQAHGFQTTSTGGPFASALVSAMLHGDSVDIALHALGIAGSQAAGNFAFIAGGDTVKAVQPGWAAHSGLIAAELARAGVTGPERVFEGERGFYRLYAGDGDAADVLAEEVRGLGYRWYLPEAAFKLYPCCHFIHPFLECLEQVFAAGVDAAEVRGVHCAVPTGQAGVIAEPWHNRQRPERAQQARWSLPYVLAVRIVRGEVTLADFVGNPDPAVVAVAERMTWKPWRESGYPTVFPARIHVITTSGKEHQSEVSDVLGGAARPLGREVVIEKFRRNHAVAGFSATESDAVVGELVRAPSPDLGVLTRLLRTGA